jgi:hypothetical protein
MLRTSTEPFNRKRHTGLKRLSSTLSLYRSRADVQAPSSRVDTRVGGPMIAVHALY